MPCLFGKINEFLILITIKMKENANINDKVLASLKKNVLVLIHKSIIKRHDEETFFKESLG